jgi:outer membrane protein
MPRLRICWVGFGLVFASALVARTFPPQRLERPRGFQNYVVNGELRLGLTGAVQLMLLNNSNVRVEQQNVGQARDAVTRSFSPFDPLFTSDFSPTRQTEPTFTQLSGASTLSSLLQTAHTGFQKTFSSGTLFQTGLSASRTSSNSIFNTFNPSVFSILNVSVTQPLLRDFGAFVNRAPIVIAERNLNQSQFQFEEEINDAIQQVIRQYWQVVQDREQLQVLEQSIQAAEASYQHDKRALELGALSPLDIYQSEAEVATRRVSVIQAEYALKQDEDQFRMSIGADLDPRVAGLRLDLVEPAKPSEPLLTPQIKTLVHEALARRPDLHALQSQLENTETSVRVARNRLKPNLSVSALYASSGLGGNELSASSARTVIARGGVSGALGQVFGFSYPTYGVSLQLSLPLRNHAAEADLADARVAREQTLYAIRHSQEQIQLDVEDAVNQIQQAKLSMSAAQIAETLAAKNVEAQQRKYELGSGLMFLVLQAQTQLAQAEASLVSAQVGYQLAVTTLEHSTGSLLDRFHVQIAQAVP